VAADASRHFGFATRLRSLSAPQAIYAEGKEHALGVGFLDMSVSEIREVNKGTAIKLIHYLNDGLWRIGDTFEL